MRMAYFTVSLAIIAFGAIHITATPWILTQRASHAPRSSPAAARSSSTALSSPAPVARRSDLTTSRPRAIVPFDHLKKLP